MRKVLFLAACFAFLCGCAPSTVDECLNSSAEYAANGEWNKALKLAERAVKLEPENVSALVMRAIVCDRLGETDRALDSARQAAALNPESFPAQYTLGRLYAADPTRLTDALRPLMQAAKLKNYQDRNTLILLANTTVALRSPLALRWFPALLRLDPGLAQNAAFRNLQGVDHAHNRRLNEAKSAFTTAYQFDRQNPVIVYNIGRFFDQYSPNKSAALQFYQAFLRQANDRPEYVHLKSEAESRRAILNH